jgi:hypothetical protein
MKTKITIALLLTTAFIINAQNPLDCGTPYSNFPLIEDFETGITPCWQYVSIRGNGSNDTVGECIEIFNNYVWKFKGNFLYKDFEDYEAADTLYQYLISPLLSNDIKKNIKLYYQYPNSISSLKRGIVILGVMEASQFFQIGYSNIDAEINNFTWLAPIIKNGISLNMSECQNFDIPQEAKYIAIKSAIWGSLDSSSFNIRINDQVINTAIEAMGTLYIDSIIVTGNMEKDLWVKEIIEPSGICEMLSDAEEVKVVVKNNGIKQVNNYTLFLQVDNNEEAIQSISLNDTLTKGDTAIYIFTNVSGLSGGGQHKIKVWCYYLEGDNNPFNDTLEVSVFNTILDIEAVSVNLSEESRALSDNEKIEVSIRNNGTIAAKNLRIFLQVDDGEILCDTIETLAVGSDNVLHVFQQGVNLSAQDTYMIKLWVDADNDINRSNDTIIKYIKHVDCIYPSTNFPIIEDFESAIEPRCWTYFHDGIPNLFTSLTDMVVSDGVFSMYPIKDILNLGSTGYLISPLLSTGKEKNISFSCYTAEHCSIIGFDCRDGSQHFEIGYSITGNKPEDFIWHDEFVESAWGWHKVEYTNIPAKARYIAIRCYPYESNGYSGMFSIDSIIINGIEPSENNLSLLTLSYPQDEANNLSDNEKIQVSIYNYGSDTAKGYKVYAQINDTPLIMELSQTNILPYGNNITYTFLNGVDFSVAGFYDIKIWVDINNDSDRTDDTIFKQIYIFADSCELPFDNFPLIENFEIPLGLCWHVISDNVENTDVLGRVYKYSELFYNSTYYNESYYAPLSYGGSYSWLFSAYNEIEQGTYNQYLISEKLSIDNNKSISFYYRNLWQGGSAIFLPSGILSIGFSITDNEPESFIWFDSVSDYARNDMENIRWKYFKVDDIPHNAKYIAIRYSSDDYFTAIVIDNIVIDISENLLPSMAVLNETIDTLLVTTTENATKTDYPLLINIEVYPNPTDGGIIVKSSLNVKMDVIDIRGVVIMSKSIYGHKKILLSNSGYYILRFTDNGGNTVTRKVLVR